MFPGTDQTRTDHHNFVEYTRHNENIGYGVVTWIFDYDGADQSSEELKGIAGSPCDKV